MSSKSMRRGRSRMRDLSAEPVKAKRSRVRQSSLGGDAIVDTAGFQMLASKLDGIVNRLDTLEKERAGTSNAKDIIIPQLHASDLITQGDNNVDNTSLASGSNVGITYIMHPTIAKPTFSGRDDTNPMRFIKRLKKYINSINGHNRAIEIATECLTGSALNILELYSEKWECLADFEKDFQRAFWGQCQQERAKYSLINSYWDSKTGTSMSEHFAEQLDSVRSLTIPFSESDMVNCVMRHFSVDVQRLWFTRKETVTIFSAAEFLREIEQNVVVRVNNEPPTNVTNRVSVRGRGQFRHVNSMSSIQANRGQSSYRRRGYRRGRNYFNSDRANSLPEIKWVRATDNGLGSMNKQANSNAESKGSEAGSSTQGDKSVLNVV